MAKEYQSEKSPIFDSQKSKKTRRKLLKMSHIKAYKLDQMFCNTRYVFKYTGCRHFHVDIYVEYKKFHYNNHLSIKQFEVGIYISETWSLQGL